jgi:DNA-binding NtrC family response regulator
MFSKGKPTLLIVDDEAILRANLAESLGKWYAVLEAGTLQQAIEITTSQDVSAVVLDLTLPDSTGPATLMAMRAKLPSKAIIVFTGYPEDIEACKDLILAGACDVIIKGSATPEQIHRSVVYAMCRRASHLQMAEHRNGIHSAACKLREMQEDVTVLMKSN